MRFGKPTACLLSHVELSSTGQAATEGPNSFSSLAAAIRQRVTNSRLSTTGLRNCDAVVLSKQGVADALVPILVDRTGLLPDTTVGRPRLELAPEDSEHIAARNVPSVDRSRGAGSNRVPRPVKHQPPRSLSVASAHGSGGAQRLAALRASSARTCSVRHDLSSPALAHDRQATGRRGAKVKLSRRWSAVEDRSTTDRDGILRVACGAATTQSYPKRGNSCQASSGRQLFQRDRGPSGSKRCPSRR